MKMSAALAAQGALPAALEMAAEMVRRDHKLFPNEIAPACEVVRHLAAGARTILVAHPMQSGKTNIMAATTHLLRGLISPVRAIYVCANDQLDLRAQNWLSLAPHVELLSRSQRKRWQPQALTCPTVVFFDESHFGDGDQMGIAQFLDGHGLLDNPLAVLVGVSATPYSSLGCMDATVWPDMAALEAAGYNSPRLMLARGRVIESERMFWTPTRGELAGRRAEVGDVTILEGNPALRHLDHLAAQDDREGYVLIRCKSHEAGALRQRLQEKWGERVYVVDWNMHNKGFSPREFFSQRRYGLLTVVLIQHKARMGSVIPTQDCHFLYEYSPKAHVDTIAQSLLGRACGFLKQDHRALIYTQTAVAEAYGALMTAPRRLERFAAFLERRRLKPSSRAVVEASVPSFELATVEAHPAKTKDSAAAIRSRCQKLKSLYGLRGGTLGAIRTLSKTADSRKLVNDRGQISRARLDAFCGKEPGNWTIVVVDRKLPARGKQPAVSEKTIVLAIRGDKRVVVGPTIGPTQASLHHHIRARRLGGSTAPALVPALRWSQLPLVAAGR